jgi:hypothetical protein
MRLQAVLALKTARHDRRLQCKPRKRLEYLLISYESAPRVKSASTTSL